MKKDIKKEVEKYMKLPYTIELIKEEDGTYYASVKEFSGCATEGDTIEEAATMIEDAMRGWIESNIERGLEIPLSDIWKLPKDFDAKKEKMRKRIKKMFGNYKLTKEEIDGLREAGNEDLIQYSMNLLRNSKGE